MKCIPQYNVDKGEIESWRCDKYRMCFGIEFKMSQTKCYHFKCQGRSKVSICKNETCNKIIDTTQGSDYCSISCTPDSKIREICKTEGCDQPVGNNKKRHCSEKCRKKDNKRAYLRRKREARLCSTKIYSQKTS